MAEKKTFNNVEIYDSADGFKVFGVGESDLLGHFPVNEWEVEVTFTKKPPKFEIGQRVRNKYMQTYTYTVLAQYKDQVIIVDENDDEIEIFGADDLVIV